MVIEDDPTIVNSSGSHSINEANEYVPKDNGLRYPFMPYGLEDVNDYIAGGHHPVNLGDVCGNNGRYRIIHKLGYSIPGIHWLGRDTEAKGSTRYVTLKILLAECFGKDRPELDLEPLKAFRARVAPQEDGLDCICLPLDDFVIHGPNGDHICLVYPVLGPRVHLGLTSDSMPSDSDLRSICLQVANAVKSLHGKGICHGGITPHNFVHRLVGLDGLDEDEVVRILGTPEANPVFNESGEPHGRDTAPRDLVYPVSWENVDAKFISQEVCLVNFSASFELAEPLEDYGIEVEYCSMELHFDDKNSFGADIWALACALFHIRTARILFNYIPGDDDIFLEGIVDVLGKFPEPWWSEGWENRKSSYEDEVDAQGRVVEILPPGCVGSDDSSDPFHERSLMDKLRGGLSFVQDGCARVHGSRDIPQAEQELFADLLGRMLKYKSEECISAAEVRDHAWFKL